MRLPDSIGSRCLANKEPFAGSWLALALEIDENEARTALSFAFGPTREDGRLLFRREEVLAQGRYLEEAVGLDYGRLEERWSGRGWLAVAGAAELRHQFRLSFGRPPLKQATAHRVAAARALRYLNEHEQERFTVAIETPLPKGVEIEAITTPPDDWLPEDLREPVLELLTRLARRDLPALVEAGALNVKTARRIEAEIIEHGAAPIVPPDIALLLATATRDSEQAWTIEVPLWTREGPSDLSASIHAHERETGLELQLRGVALA